MRQQWERVKARLRAWAQRWRAAGPPGVFLDGSFTNRAGTRAYRLFVPGMAARRRLPLVVMLHGCKQNPDDFAAGTRMNELAEALGWVVLYPAQDRRANAMGCWNWFLPAHQDGDRGEPSIIADMTREVIATRRIDPQRVYVAGLSAGGAMASILASTCPDLYAAAGIHSGLPHAVATDLASALRAMQHGPSAKGSRRDEGRIVPTIVFHGDQDTTVHPRNSHEVVAQARWTTLDDGLDRAGTAPMAVEQAQVPAGHRYTRTVHRDALGRADAEHWVVHGSGHAWSGGSPAGSYTDPLGPDASREMLRFFAEHPMR